MNMRMSINKWAKIYNLAKKIGFDTVYHFVKHCDMYDLNSYNDVVKHLESLAK